MSKRARKVAFADEVQVEEDKRRREDGAGEDEEDDPESGDRGKKSECAPIGIISPHSFAVRDAVQVEAFAG